MVNNDGNNPKKSPSTDESTSHDPSRRQFMKKSGLVIGGVAGGSLLGGLFTNKFQSEPDTATTKDNDKKPSEEARMFFRRFSDFAILEQATERIYPKDEHGPGAIELGVPYFIDRQLAGSWGLNGKDYRQGPFHEGGRSTNNSIVNRGDIFLMGLRAIDAQSQKKFNITFDKAEKEQQNEILQAFEAGEVDMIGVTSGAFFSLLRQTTLEGAYCDPLYGGNKNMSGWKMKEYPGPVPSYANIIEDEDFVLMDPISLTDYQRKK